MMDSTAIGAVLVQHVASFKKGHILVWGWRNVHTQTGGKLSDTAPEDHHVSSMGVNTHDKRSERSIPQHFGARSLFIMNVGMVYMAGLPGGGRVCSWRLRG